MYALGWSVQKPARLKAWLAFIDEPAFMMARLVRRNWAPLIVVAWDRLVAHWAQRVRTFLNTHLYLHTVLLPLLRRN